MPAAKPYNGDDRMNKTPRNGRAAPRGATAVAALTLAMGACDLTVTNPGPIQDEFLDDIAAAPAVVNGMEAQLSQALGWMALTGGIIAREIVPSGHNVNNYGVRERARQGELVPGETSPHWDNAHEARWLAEDGIRRFREVLGDEFESSELAARALVYAGFSNRLLGENMCSAVFDGGPEENHLLHFERAEDQFTEALAIALNLGDTQMELAALAGRASVRIWLDDWSGALTDAALVPSDFEYEARHNTGADEQYNRLFWAGASNPFRNVSVVNTFYEDYYEATGDPRTPWSFDPEFPLGTGANVTFYRQEKYPSRTAPMNLASGREMRLLEAEGLLRGDDPDGAMTVINQLRADVGVPAWEADTGTEAWEALKRERGIELWLEARRLPDLRRWEREGVPGEVVDMTGRDLCFPVGLTEMETNPNIPITS